MYCSAYPRGWASGRWTAIPLFHSVGQEVDELLMKAGADSDVYAMTQPPWNGGSTGNFAEDDGSRGRIGEPAGYASSSDTRP